MITDNYSLTNRFKISFPPFDQVSSCGEWEDDKPEFVSTNKNQQCSPFTISKNEKLFSWDISFFGYQKSNHRLPKLVLLILLSIFNYLYPEKDL